MALNRSVLLAGPKVPRLFQHTFKIHPEQPLPTGYKEMPFIVL